jgi:hypothetical protein
MVVPSACALQRVTVIGIAKPSRCRPADGDLGSPSASSSAASSISVSSFVGVVAESTLRRLEGCVQRGVLRAVALGFSNGSSIRSNLA